MKYHSLFLVLGLVVFSSCGPKLTPFTQDLYDENGWTDDDLERIQFYLSEDIICGGELRRDLLLSALEK